MISKILIANITDGFFQSEIVFKSAKGLEHNMLYLLKGSLILFFQAVYAADHGGYYKLNAGGVNPAREKPEGLKSREYRPMLGKLP